MGSSSPNGGESWNHQPVKIYIYIFTPTWWLILLKDSPNRENIEVGRWCLWNYSNYNHTMSRWLSKTSSSRFKQSATDVPAKARNEDAIGEAFLAAKNNILPSLPCFSSSCVFSTKTSEINVAKETVFKINDAEQNTWNENMESTCCCIHHFYSYSCVFSGVKTQIL